MLAYLAIAFVAMRSPGLGDRHDPDVAEAIACETVVSERKRSHRWG
jgi:hypothetical protein